MKQLFSKSFYSVLALCIVSLYACANNNTNDSTKKENTNAPDVTLKLPDGFSSVVFAEGLGGTRHLTVNANGDVYVKLSRLKDGKGIYRLRDANGDGKAEDVTGFSDIKGTGIAIKNGYLYASSDEEVFRFKLDANNNIINPDKPEKIVTGLLSRHEHEAKAIALDNDGNLYVNIGAYSNACQVDDRQKGSPGMKPCPILDSAGGIWQFKADKQNQTYGDGARYATGLRNVVGLDWNTATNTLFVMQHGRDQLHDLFPDMYTTKQSAELPAECMYELHKGSNCGWPYIYYDEFQNKKILAPEFGGRRQKKAGEDVQDPVVAFPGHLAPNGLLFYTGNQFPEKYKNGAFVVFHGSWNRAPEPQEGYYVVFVPFKDGKPSGKWEVFADGFSGGPEFTASGKAKHRPCGIAQAPDGSIYISDDVKGTIWKITYKK